MLIFTKTIVFLFRQVISVRIVKATTAIAAVIDNHLETYSSTNPMLISMFKIVLAFPMAHPQKRLALVILIFFDPLVMAFQPLFVPPQSFTNLLKFFLSIFLVWEFLSHSTKNSISLYFLNQPWPCFKAVSSSGNRPFFSCTA